MDTPLIIGLSGTLLAAASVILIFRFLRPPLFVMGGNMMSRDLCDRIMQRLRVASLVAIALLPMEGAERILVLAQETHSLDAFLAQTELYAIAIALILCPLLLTRVFRSAIARLVARQRQPLGGLNVVLGAYAGLTAVTPFAAFYLMNNV